MFVSWFRAVLARATVALALPCLVAAQPQEPPPAAAAPVAPPAAIAPATAAPQEPAPPLQSLNPTTTAALERLATLIRDKTREREATAKDAPARLAALDTELRELSWQFAGLASRLDVQDFEAPKERSFDLQKEVEQLIRPLIQTIKDATEEPRQVADLKARIEALQQRQKIAEGGQRAVERTRDLLPAGSAARAEAERDLQQRWRPTIDGLRGEILVLQARLLARQEGKQSLVESVSQTVETFVRTSGLSLLLAALVFSTVLFGLRWLQNRLLGPRTGERRFSLRLTEIVLSVLSLLVAIAATLVVPYVRDDWLLLAVGIVFLVGAGWVLVRMAPQFFEQIRLLLNIGSVREGERIEIDGLPYRIDQLRFHSRLHNPALDGGTLRVPIQSLIGKRSRRGGQHEPWFPTRPGDEVILADGTFGPVLQQTPSVVVVRYLGAPRSYPTAAFLALCPRNLSHGFVVDTAFGIDYRHQAVATTQVPEWFRTAIEQGLAALQPPAHATRVEVQFQAAGSSSLDFLVLAEFAGELAARHGELRRAVQRLLVEACATHGLTIPFPQLVVHQPER